MKEINVRQWRVNFNNGMYDNKDVHTQIDAGWYDWFCRDTSLAAKTKKMGNIVNQLRDGGKIDFDKNYVWFKNNCPCIGNLYDDFRFADLETGDVLFTIQCDHPHGSEYMYEVYGRQNGFYEPLLQAKTTKQLVDWLNTAWKEV